MGATNNYMYTGVRISTKRADEKERKHLQYVGLSTTLVVQVNQSVRRVCIQTMTFEPNIL